MPTERGTAVEPFNEHGVGNGKDWPKETASSFAGLTKAGVTTGKTEVRPFTLEVRPRSGQIYPRANRRVAAQGSA